MFDPVIGQLFRRTPYAVQSANPVTVSRNMRSDTEEASRSFQILNSWGVKLVMEQIAAPVPTTFVRSSAMWMHQRRIRTAVARPGA